LKESGNNGSPCCMRTISAVGFEVGTLSRAEQRVADIFGVDQDNDADQQIHKHTHTYIYI